MDVSSYQFVDHPAWMVFDGEYLRRYGLAGHTAAAPTPSWIVEAPTLKRWPHRRHPGGGPRSDRVSMEHARGRGP